MFGFEDVAMQIRFMFLHVVGNMLYPIRFIEFGI